MMTNFMLDEIFLIIGIYLSAGYILSIFLQKYHIPNIITYVLTGFFLSNFFLKDQIAGLDLHDAYIMVETVALGLIGFIIGTELKFKKLHPERVFITVILIFEAGLTLVFVFSLVWAFSGNLLLSMILGGLATATAPATTVEIIKRLRAKGPVTDRLQWILAFDDLAAIFLVNVVLIIVSETLGGVLSIAHFFEDILWELGLAILIGLVVGVVFDLVIERIRDELQMMELTIGVLFLVMAVTHMIGTSVITTTMVIGAVTTNLKGDNYARAGDLLEVVMSPIILLFFLFVGSNLRLDDLSHFPWIALVYLFGRTSGKIIGAFAGGKVLNADPKIANNLGLGLLAQGGVTLGLASLANEILIAGGREDLGHELLTIIVVSTVISEILGAIGTSIAVRRAGEHNKRKVKPEPLPEDDRHRDIALSHIP